MTPPFVISPPLPAEGPVRGDLDQYGGWTGLKGNATGFFHLENLSGRDWLVTPEGNVFYALQMGWSDTKDSDLIKSWGFNTSEPNTGMPYAKELNFLRAGELPMLPLEKHPAYPPWVSFPDVFDPRWPELCKQHAEKELGPIKDDPLLVGYFMSNEVCLFGWYEAVFKAPVDAPCRAAFVEVARAYYQKKPDNFAKDWAGRGMNDVADLARADASPDIPGLAAAWYEAVAERAFGVASRAAKEVDPNHLNFSLRLFNAPPPPVPILKILGKYSDAVSVNFYSILPDRLMTQAFTLIPVFHTMTGRPIFVSEFSYRGGDTDLPNTQGAPPTVKTQAQRAIGYLSYVSALASLPFQIGVSWYKIRDDVPSGKWFDYSEDCNFGAMDAQDRPYAVLTSAMRAVNARIYEIAADPVRNDACKLFYRTELMRWDNPQDGLIFQRLTGSSTPFEDPLAKMLPEPRRFHECYWVRHKSPTLSINDERFAGWCEANLFHTGADAQTLDLINVQAFTSFPRSFWYGTACERPDDSVVLESNAQFLSREVDKAGTLRRMSVADGSFAQIDFKELAFRLDKRAAWFDMRFDPDAKTLDIVSRGPAQHAGIFGIEGWQVRWNDAPVPPESIEQRDSVTLVSMPGANK